MPFDGVGSNPSLTIVNHMLWTLSDPEHWTKSCIRERLPQGGYAYCLAGALRFALTTLPKDQRRAAARPVRNTMNRLIKQTTDAQKFRFVKHMVRVGLMPHVLIIQFNDDTMTSHHTVMSLLRQTRDHLQLACVTG
jgi:hypothetical protein